MSYNFFCSEQCQIFIKIKNIQFDVKWLKNKRIYKHYMEKLFMFHNQDNKIRNEIIHNKTQIDDDTNIIKNRLFYHKQIMVIIMTI